MTVTQGVLLISFAAFSIIDLRIRLVPFIEAFFVLAVVLAFRGDLLHVSVLVLAVIWGLFHHIPTQFALPFLFFPVCWPTLIIGFGVRKQMIGRADLLAVAMIGFFFPFAAVVMSLLGFEVWRRWWIRRGNYGLMPAIPGLFLGLATYSVLQIGFSQFFPM